jgi:hypothetical protein
MSKTYAITLTNIYVTTFAETEEEAKMEAASCMIEWLQRGEYDMTVEEI